jgi:RNA recognition motif-containing protein
MDLYVGPLGENITVDELNSFFANAIRAEVDLQIYTRVSTGGDTRYAVASMPSKRVAEKAIKKLNHRPLDGYLVNVREFIYRSSNNEKRMPGCRDKMWGYNERRASHDRRKHLKIIAEEEISFHGYREFATKQI